MPIHLELSIAETSEFRIANEIRYFTVLVLHNAEAIQ